MSPQKSGQSKNMFVSVLTVIIALTGLLAPATQAASLSTSGSLSMTNTPSFSASMSGSFSATQSYSMTAALTQSPSYSSSISYSASFNSVSFSGTMSFAASRTFSAVPSGGYLPPFVNHCPLQSTAICLFWDSTGYSSYRVTVMNSSGSMLTYDNIVISPLELPQLPLSYDSTNGFIQPDSTYRFQLFGCTSPGVCVEAYTPQTFTTSPRRRPVCDPNYLCNARCVQIQQRLIECTWTNSKITPLKRAILRVSTAYQLTTLVGINVRGLKNITVRNPKPIPSSLRLIVPSNAIVNIQLIMRYHPTRPNNVVLRTTFFT